ncbi:uncharacterized protein [Typha angustifolia]|uniref:uncharacterized protein n=1 Tax=Typha angustifolia TaxID=59011 RepID=UPI003C2AED9A
MVWFQCEDCGENLRKPKLPNHFRVCSAYKLSCIDCGEMFNQESVQSHTQCISEAEKYGPKGQGRAPSTAQAKPDKPKHNADVDVYVGLSSHPPWFCSLCNTNTTSKQTLLLHADGKKHRAKARAFHAAQKQSNVGEVTTSEKGISGDVPMPESVEANGFKKGAESDERDTTNDTAKKDSLTKRKREDNAPVKELQRNMQETYTSEIVNGEVIQAGKPEGPQCKPKKKKLVGCEDLGNVDPDGKEASKQKIKWKKVISSTLKSNPDRVMKLKKLQKLVIKALKDSGVIENEDQLLAKLMDKINSSSQFAIDNKRITLVAKGEES